MNLSTDYNSINHKAIALWDMDGTLADYDKAMNDWQERLKSAEETWEGRAHGFLTETSAPWMAERIALVRNLPGFWSSLEPLQQGFDLINAFEHFEFENHILTKGPSTRPNAWSEKVKWCRDYLPDFYVHISEKKSLVYGKVLIDDWPDYFMSWLEVRPRGLVVAIEWPWNKHVRHERLVHYNGRNLDEVVNRVGEAREDAGDAVARPKYSG